MKMNHHYGELKASYLFVDIAHRMPPLRWAPKRASTATAPSRAIRS